MTVFDPVYGELLTAKECAAATGFTMNQLRNWRMPHRLEKAPFGYVQIGVSPHYRKATVEKWLETNVEKNVRYVPAGLDLEIPINEAVSMDLSKQKHLSALADINTSTMWLRWFTRISETLRTEFSPKFKREQKRLYSIYSGMPEDEVPNLVYGNRFENFELYYVSSVLALRSLWAEINEWSVSDQELIDLPIGDTPPAKEIK